MKNKIVYVVASAVILFASCKSTKQLTKTEPAKKANPTVKAIDEVQKNQPQFKTANINKLTLDLNVSERQLSVSSSAKIRKDSAIFVSFQVFGMELFKAEMMPDSMKVIDKMNRKFYVVDYSFFQKKFGVDADFYSIQSLLTAQLFCIGQRQILEDSCKLVAGTDGTNTLLYDSERMSQATHLSAQNMIQDVLIKAKNSSYILKTNYSEYTSLGGVNFPQKISLVANNDKQKASCDFSVLKAEFNTDIKFQATNTEKYTRGQIEQLLRK